MVAIDLLGDEADRNQLDARRKPSAVGGLPTPSGVFHGLARVPTIPHRECLIVSGPSKILLRNATSTLSISESGAPVRRLRPKSRPFVVAPELAIPIFSAIVSRRYFMSSPPELPVLLLSLCFHENNFEKRSFARLGRDVADPLIG